MISTKTTKAADPAKGSQASQAYQGDTYYGLQALKNGPYGWLVTTYFFVGGVASAAQFLATVVDYFGKMEDRVIVRAGRYIALLGALISPFLLIADLHTPQRWYNMLRIFRPTSSMSIGSWSLISFGTLSGFVAVGQALEDLFGSTFGRWLARLTSLPAAVAGGVVAIYTGTLLASTNIPLWTTAHPFLSSLFATSAASTASAALSLAANAENAGEDTRRRLTWFALIAGAAELLLMAIIGRRWRKAGVAAPVSRPTIGPVWALGAHGVGVIGPLAVHAYEMSSHSNRKLNSLAAVATLIGGFMLRAVFIFGGKRSGERPQDYFQVTKW